MFGQTWEEEMDYRLGGTYWKDWRCFEAYFQLDRAGDGNKCRKRRWLWFKWF